MFVDETSTVDSPHGRLDTQGYDGQSDPSDSQQLRRRKVPVRLHVQSARDESAMGDRQLGTAQMRSGF